ncbi:hypothetical protein [Ferrimonas pelagia]
MFMLYAASYGQPLQAADAMAELFADDFEQHELARNGWRRAGRAPAQRSAEAAFDGATGALLREGAGMVRTLDVTNLRQVTLAYDRRAVSLSGEDRLRVEWSVDGGPWQQLESTQDSTWQRSQFQLGFEANRTARVRFVVNSHQPQHQAHIDNVQISGLKATAIVPQAQLDSWPFEGRAGLVATAQLAGSYAVADPQELRIELRDIRQASLAVLQAHQLRQVLPEADDESRLCGMALSSSGRHLFVGICTGEGREDAILAYNSNTQALSLFARLTLTDRAEQPQLGMSFYQGQLLVGTQSGVLALDASPNAVASGQPAELLWRNEIPSQGEGILGLAVDMPAQILYLQTSTALYQRPFADGVVSQILHGRDLRDIAFARTYGAEGQGGLYLLQNDGAQAEILTIPTALLRSGEALNASAYLPYDPALSSLAATADGRLLLADGGAKILSDGNDQRLGFDDWLRDELQQYIALAHVVSAAPADVAFASDKALIGPAMLILIAADRLSVEPQHEVALQRLALRVREQGAEWLNMAAPEAQSPWLLLVPALYQAAQHYPQNEILNSVQEWLRQSVRQAEIEFQPEVAQHSSVYGALMAARDPLLGAAQIARGDKTAVSETEGLLGEEVRQPMTSLEAVLSRSALLRHFAEAAEQIDQSRRYYAIAQAEGEAAGLPYFSVMVGAGDASAAPGQERSAARTGSSQTDFSLVLGLGQYGLMPPVVGAYQAYRDGRRQTLALGENGEPIQLLWRGAEPSAAQGQAPELASLWLGAWGLVEALQPGALAPLREDYFRAEPQLALSSDGSVRLHYSQLTPRRVVAITPDDRAISFGYQLSPFHVVNPHAFKDFRVEQPKGELLELNDVTAASPGFINPDFSQDLDGWTTSASSGIAVVDGEGAGLVGPALQLHTSAEQRGALTVCQSLSLAADLPRTRYRIRANGLLRDGMATDQAFLRLQWVGQSSGQRSEPLDGETPQLEFVLETIKPKDANALRLCFVAQQRGESHRFLFDNLSVERLGAEVKLRNGDFSQGLAHWTVSSEQIQLTEPVEGELPGKQALRFELPSDSQGWHWARRDLYVDKEQDGTRYRFQLRLQAAPLDDAEFEIQVLVKDEAGQTVRRYERLARIESEVDGPIRFELRKQPQDAHYQLLLRMRRAEQPGSEVERVLIEELTLMKQR